MIAERELYKFPNLDQTKKFRAIIAECSGRFEGTGINLFRKLQSVFNILTIPLRNEFKWFASIPSMVRINSKLFHRIRKRELIHQILNL